MSPTISRAAVSGTTASDARISMTSTMGSSTTSRPHSSGLSASRLKPPVAGSDLEQPVDGSGLLPGGLAPSSGGAAGRRAQHELDALGGQDAQDGVDQRRLAHARSSRDDGGHRGQRQPHRLGLARPPATGRLCFSTQVSARSKSMSGQGSLPATRSTSRSAIARSACYKPPRNTHGVSATVSATTASSASSSSRAVRSASSGTSSRRAASGPSSSAGSPPWPSSIASVSA